jgi:hypothetical protein
MSDGGVQRHRARGLDKVTYPPVAALRHRCHDRVAVKSEKRHRGREDTGALVFAFVQELASGAGDDRMHARLAEVWRRHHRAQRRLDRSSRVGEEARDTRQGLVRLGVEHVEDRTDEEGVAGLFPMIAFLQGTFRVDQDVGDVLNIANFPLTATDLEQRIVGGALGIGRIEQQDTAEASPPSGGQGPVLALDVVDDRRTGPGQQGRDHEADALAAASRRETQHVLGSVMAKIRAVPATDDDTVRIEEPGLADLRRLGPAR